MPKKRVFTPIEALITQTQVEMGHQTAAELFSSEVSVATHVTKMKLVVALVEARAAKKITQSQLSAITGIPQGEISRLEGGLANPTLETVVKLCVALGLTLEFAAVSK